MPVTGRVLVELNRFDETKDGLYGGSVMALPPGGETMAGQHVLKIGQELLFRGTRLGTIKEANQPYWLIDVSDIQAVLRE